MKWYKEKKWYQAIPVIDNVLPEYKGTDTSEILYYMLAESYYNAKEYMVAAYHFKTFKDLYPKSYKAEVALLRTAECYEKSMGFIELEQTTTEKTIEYYKAFVSEYPKSPLVEEAQEKIAKLNRVLELKFLNSADLYFKTKNYRAAAVTYKNVLSQYPNIKEYELINYRICLSYYDFARKSYLTKQSERYETALEACNNFINRFPESKYKEDIQNLGELSRENVVWTAYENANQYAVVEERPYYYEQALALWSDYKTEFNEKIPTKLKDFDDKCRLGVIKSYFLVFDNVKDEDKRVDYYNKLVHYYLSNEDKFDQKTPEFAKAKDYYERTQQLYKKS